MISKYDGKCSICTKPIPKGTECNYDASTKTVQHYDCLENPKPGPEAFRLADSLGFIQYDQNLPADGLCGGCCRPIEAEQPGGTNVRHIHNQTPLCSRSKNEHPD